MDRKTNEEVLKMVGEERKQLDVMLDRKKNWIGHVLRGNGLMLEVMEARMVGKRGRERRRIGMLEELMEETYDVMKRKHRICRETGSHGPAARQNTNTNNLKRLNQLQ